MHLAKPVVSVEYHTPNTWINILIIYMAIVQSRLLQ